MITHELQLDLENFQGPFDLLLHLIKQMEVDINDIPMVDITKQYLSYIDSMNELQLDIVGDYLVMASTLLEIKSSLLLPVEPDPKLEDDYSQDDPREALVQQLLLYQQFQNVAEELEIKHGKRSRLYTRPMGNISSYQEFIPLDPDAISLSQLTEAMESVLKKVAQRQPLSKEISHEILTVTEQIEKIYQAFSRCNTNNGIIFDSLIETGSRTEIVTTFLAMLELVKKQKIVFIQEDKDQEIKLIKIEEIYS